MQYLVAWIVVFGAGVCGLFGLYVLSRPIRALFPRAIILGLVAVWMFTPAPVPNFEGQYAPAFVVMMFEWLLQTDGEPGVALRILIAASVAVVGLLSLAFGLKNLQRRGQEPLAPDKEEPSATDKEPSA